MLLRTVMQNSANVSWKKRICSSSSSQPDGSCMKALGLNANVFVIIFICMWTIVPRVHVKHQVCRGKRIGAPAEPKLPSKGWLLLAVIGSQWVPCVWQIGLRGRPGFLSDEFIREQLKSKQKFQHSGIGRFCFWGWFFCSLVFCVFCCFRNEALDSPADFSPFCVSEIKALAEGLDEKQKYSQVHLIWLPDHLR